MTRTRVEMMCRFQWPDINDYSHANRFKAPLRWYRQTHTGWLDHLDGSGTYQLPAPMFTWSSADYWVIRWESFNDRLMVSLNANGQPLLRWTEWERSSFWQEFKFDPSPMGGQRVDLAPIWWLRLRVPDGGNSLHELVMNTLDDIDTIGYGRQGEVIGTELIEIRKLTAQLRREIVMYRLGGVIPKRLPKGE